MTHRKQINQQRRRRRFRVSNAVKRHSTRCRLSVFRSHKHICAQIVDDEGGRTLASASTLEKTIRQQLAYGGNCQAAAAVGKLLAERALAAGVSKAAFDRREYKYHGRVAALADAARDAGLDLGAKAPPPAEKPKPQKAKPKSPKQKVKQ